MYLVECTTGEMDEERNWQHVVASGKLAQYLAEQCRNGPRSEQPRKPFLIEEPKDRREKKIVSELPADPEALIVDGKYTTIRISKDVTFDRFNDVFLTISRLADREFDATLDRTRAEFSNKGWADTELDFG